MKSNVDLAEVTQTTSREWMRFAQEGIEHGFDRFKMFAAIPRARASAISKRKLRGQS